MLNTVNLYTLCQKTDTFRKFVVVILGKPVYEITTGVEKENNEIDVASTAKAML